MMTGSLISNKADFQRHFNGCEQRLKNLTKSLETIQHLSQHALVDQTQYFSRLDDFIAETKALCSSISILEESPYSLNAKRRLTQLKRNLEKNRRKFEQIRHHAQTTFGYEYCQNANEEIVNGDSTARKQSIAKHSNDIHMELMFMNEHSTIVQNLERDFLDLNQAFKDLDLVVHEQSIMVNNIEEALARTHSVVRDGIQEIDTTRRARRRSTKFKWLFISFSLFCVLLLTTIIYLILKFALSFR